MRESRTYGSVRGALSNERPYRNPVFAGYAERCAADPGSFQTRSVGRSRVRQRATISAYARAFDAIWRRCEAPGSR